MQTSRTEGYFELGSFTKKSKKFEFELGSFTNEPGQINLFN